MRFISPSSVRLSVVALLPILSLLASSCLPNARNSQGGYTIFGVIYAILVIYAVLNLLKQDWSLGKKLIWGLIILAFPIGGSIIYLLFSGRSS